MTPHDIIAIKMDKIRILKFYGLDEIMTYENIDLMFSVLMEAMGKNHEGIEPLSHKSFF